ncbi:diguanylate cyclase domain-containing protein [Undibacterium pigrum]|uniref:Response regulator receiver modulated diguanylate cyclase with PAS/PAC sensor n=1 Tax=Undibacterium pigrum TaxID=401470 RepID=A0A318J8R4_9BURK|nr:diguanylate cyclase [Undibacterium pigrum]PXX44080.1 response regulator receiver modulated diguanylate cyclase with PAS/PAC sensor [Undibacterium pigrum]
MVHRILILTSNSDDAKILQEALLHSRDGPFLTECLDRLDAGLSRLHTGGIDLILVDLSLSDSQGIATFNDLFAAFPKIPIMTLSAEEEEAAAIEAVKLGAQGYLSKGYFVSSLVPQSLRNIILRKNVEKQLYKEQARAEIVLKSIGDAIVCTDINGEIDYLNAAAEELTGWSKTDACGQQIEKIFKTINGVSRQADVNTVELVLKKNEIVDLPANTLLIRKDGSEVHIEDSASPIHDYDGQLAGAVIVFHDVSIAQAVTVKMTHLAQHDALTNLPNRTLLNDRIAQAINLAKRNGTRLALLFLDLDNFKHTNDSLGHASGDALLKSVALRLSDCVRGSDTVSRYGGDEFIILLVGGKYAEDAALIAEKIRVALLRPFQHEERDLYAKASIGISLYPNDGQNAETLISSADTAMYCAKIEGSNNFKFFRSDMKSK